MIKEMPLIGIKTADSRRGLYVNSHAAERI
ncbi:MAG: hypothetical protein RL324_2478 [Verrucomicrobiota bacterium]|jgi:hypothetical protein